MKVTIHCPFCGMKYDLDEFQEGRETTCNKCSRKFPLDRNLVDVWIPVSEEKTPSPESPTQSAARSALERKTAELEEKLREFERRVQKFEQRERAATAPGSDKTKKHEVNWVYVAMGISIWIFLGTMTFIFNYSLIPIRVDVESIAGDVAKTANAAENAANSARDAANSAGAAADAAQAAASPITDFKIIISRNFLNKERLADQIGKALEAGYEPAGYLGTNNNNDAMFLFVKRKK